MTATLAPFPTEQFEKYSGNATADSLRPLIEAAYADVASVVEETATLSKAKEGAEEELASSETPEAIALREAEAVVARNEEAEKKAFEELEAKQKAEKEALKARFAPLKEQKTKVKEARANAITAIAQQRVANIDTDALSEKYKKSTEYVKALTSPLKVVGVDIAFNFPTFAALTSPKSFGGGNIADGERGWRPRFITIYVNGERVESKTSPKTGKVSTQLEDAAKKAGVNANSIKTVLENRLGGRTFTEGTLDSEGYYTFTVNHNGKDIEFMVQPQIKNTEDVDQDNDTE